jgi:hypothetical protein
MVPTKISPKRTDVVTFGGILQDAGAAAGTRQAMEKRHKKAASG